jgi:hypothetical protein
MEVGQEEVADFEAKFLRVDPGFRASLVQPSASLRPFHSGFASFKVWEIHLPLRFC